MDKNTSENPTKIIYEITSAEHKRARKLADDSEFIRWVGDLRQKYIVKGFLMPLYARDGLYSRSTKRVDKLGNYILRCEESGEKIAETSKGWIHNEEMWFWWYLTEGQEIVSSTISIPDALKVEGSPANSIWQDIIEGSRIFHLFGEDGGGIAQSTDWIDKGYLASNKQLIEWDESESGYLKPFPLPGMPNWINLYHTYERLAGQSIEIRPAWFHLAKHIFFNGSLEGLPIFFTSFTGKGNIERITFLDSNLSDEARNYVGKLLLDMPLQLKQQANSSYLKKERREMVWWLWHNVGHKDQKRKLSYNDIAEIAGTSRSSVQTAIKRFDDKLKNNLDQYLLGQLLQISQRLGLGYNLTYRALVQKGVVPDRERDIDGFDDLDKLI
jgi:hypothetical protein